MISATHTAESRPKVNVNKLRLYVGAAVALAALGLFFGREPYGYGLVPLFSGLGLRLWASGHLSKNAALTTSGPYRYVRHPLYLGTLIAFLAVPFLAGIYWLIPVVLAMVFPVYLWRIAHEEHELRLRFGEPYEAYERAVPALLPVPWRRLRTGGGGRFSWRRAAIENRWHKGLLYAVLALLAADLVDDILYPALVLHEPLGMCLREMLDFTQLWTTGRF